MNFFQLMNVILKFSVFLINQITLLQQHYFNHFHMIFRIKNKQNFTNTIEDQRPWWVFTELACQSDISER